MSFLSNIGKALGQVHHTIRGVAETPLKSLPGGNEIIKLNDKGDKLAENAAPVVAGAIGAYFGGEAGATAGYAFGSEIKSGLREEREERETKQQAKKQSLRKAA